jgi:hypothetical protein
LFCANFSHKNAIFQLFANFLQKFCKFGSKKVKIARFRRNLGPFRQSPEQAPVFLALAALEPLLAELDRQRRKSARKS